MTLHMERNYSLKGNQRLPKEKVPKVKRRSSRLRVFKKDDTPAIAELKKSPCLIKILKTPINHFNPDNQ